MKQVQTFLKIQYICWYYLELLPLFVLVPTSILLLVAMLVTYLNHLFKINILPDIINRSIVDDE
jgi:hypothetical protein